MLPRIYKYFIDKDKHNTIIMEHIDGYDGHQFDKIKLLSDSLDHKHRSYWVFFIMHLAYFINILGQHKIQHNDFHRGNIIVKNGLQIKIIDLETLTDYYNTEIFSNMVKTSSNKEKTRMGWSNVFHPGSDLNQILGKITEKYQNIMPADIYNDIKSRIINYSKEFPYAISEQVIKL